MNRDEARELLLRELSCYRKKAYSELQQELDIENVKRVAGNSGVEYFVEVSVERVNEIDPAIEVNGYASEVRGRRFLPKTERFEALRWLLGFGASTTMTRRSGLGITSSCREPIDRSGQS